MLISSIAQKEIQPAGMPQEHEMPAPVTTTIRLLLYTAFESSAKIRLE
jgi:hypothetical protein